MIVIHFSDAVHNTTFNLQKYLQLYLVEFGMEGATELHVLDQVGPLSLIGRNDANLIGFCSSLQ